MQKEDIVLPTELIKQLLEAGVHFGHKTSRWNPKMKRFIFGQRSGIHIIDLEKTQDCINKARDFLMEITSKGEMVLFVGTKKQAQEIVQEEATRCGMYYVTERWLGGLLTNFFTIKKRITRLKEIENMKQDGTFEKLTKKEVAGLEKELSKLKKNFSGVVQMEKFPKAVIIIDTEKEKTALREARRLSIPIIAIVDTNSDPDQVTYPIVGNDDAAKSIRVITHLLVDTIIEGRKKFLSYLSEEGVSIVPKEEKEEEPTAILPKEEIKIKEFEEIEEAVKDSPEPPRGGRPRQTPQERTKTKKKI